MLEVQQNLQKKIKELRREYGMSQKELAELIKVDRSTVVGWETKGRMPDVMLLINVANVFGVSLDSLVGRNIQE